MRFMSRVSVLLGLLVSACLAPSQSQQTSPSELLPALVKQQFGPAFSVPEKFPTPAIVADFNGDGVDDIAIVASSTEPMPDSVSFNYKIMDPYNGYFGMGNPAITMAFSAPDPRHNWALLVIFGAGADAWRSATPKDKFVLVNVPFDTIAVGRMLVKKKKPPIFVIKAQEKEVMDSAVYWDGKKWKWEPGNMGN